MHPIERLRYVARSEGAGQDLLVRETAGALAAFQYDPAGLVTACRRIVDRQPTAGALWWLTARMLTAPEPMREAYEAIDEIDQDLTPRRLSAGLPDDATITVLGWPEVTARSLPRRGDIEVLVVDAAGEGSSMVRRLLGSDVEAVDIPSSGLGPAVVDSQVVVLEAHVVGPESFVTVMGARAAASTARLAGVPVWLVVPVGRLLPQRMWDAAMTRIDPLGDPWDRDEEIVPLDLVDQVVGPNGLETIGEMLKRTDAPIAPELFNPLT
ncbi:MAG: hypothetical protein GY929_17405 [Actinomycetia bacterium]|nr:hypothetical protein [Actinomycetes bacterium]